MFYFLISSLLGYRFLLIAAAVIPALFLMVKVYRSDRLEKESPQMLLRLVAAGVFATLAAMILERVLSWILGAAVKDRTLYQVLLYFGIVAFSEEGAKYFFLKRRTWRTAEFDCLYDGVVYAVFVALGFALWENISYVLHYGFSTALVRAVTAIPGHTCFGVFMGVFYGIAKRLENAGQRGYASLFRGLSVLVPALLHGCYDYIASSDGEDWYFLVFIAVLFGASYVLVNRMSRRDHFI